MATNTQRLMQQVEEQRAEIERLKPLAELGEALLHLPADSRIYKSEPCSRPWYGENSWGVCDWFATVEDLFKWLETKR